MVHPKYPGENATMNYTLSILGLVNLIGAGLSYAVHGGTVMPQLHAIIEALMR